MRSITRLLPVPGPGPGEMVRPESFQHEPKAGTLGEGRLHTITLAIVEGLYGSSKRIELHRLFKKLAYAVSPASEVCRLAVQVDTQI